MFTRKDHDARRAEETPASPGGAGDGAAQPAPRIAYAGTMCLLDAASGAAISVRTALETLAEAGCTCHAFSASLFDSNTEVRFAPALGKVAEAEASRGKILRIRRDGVEHLALLTASSRGPAMTPEEQTRLAERFRAWVMENRPQVVVSYGASHLAKRMRADARATGAQVVHYLANAEIDDAELVAEGDAILCPSEFLAARYRERYGVDAGVLYPVIRPDRVRREGVPSVCDMPEARKLGFVTFINPLPHKGLTLFVKLVQRAAQERPEMRFLVLEGRMPREALVRLGVDLPEMANLWFLPPQKDMAAVYARTAVLLVPSFWREGFGRAVVEAQLAGVPVLAADNGGLGEALAGGAAPLPVPEKCVENHYSYPDDATVDAWWQALCRLWDDGDAYAGASRAAREAGARFTPDATRLRVLETFAEMIVRREAVE